MKSNSKYINKYTRMVKDVESFKSHMKNTMQKRITDLLSQLTDGIHERDQIMALSLLGAIAGHNTFLFGPPGTAKSLISRRLASAFENPHYFEYLMNRFSTPEEVFGPVSIKALKEDRYIRQIQGYLPTADFAFLDEIWKASPAILNNLLTIINERIFKNGDEQIEVPLKALIAASNEIPPENQGLEALYDRFILRLFVPPIEQEENFNQLLDSKPSNDKLEISSNLRINYHELTKWRDQLHEVKLNEDTLLIIKSIRKELTERFDELGVYISDRRWQRAATLLKAAAFCNGRRETNHSDVTLLKYCLWTTPDNREAVEKIVMNSVKSCGFNTDVDLAALDREKESLDKEINKELYYSKDIYQTITLPDGRQYFKVIWEDVGNDPLYIKCSYLKTNQDFNLVNSNGNGYPHITGNFNGQGSCKLEYKNYYHRTATFTPKVLFHKGDKKEDINIRLIESLAQSVSEIRKQLVDVLKQVEKKHTDYQKFLQSPFVTQSDIDVAVSGILDQIDKLNLRIKDCERLESLCR
ncbi:AAA family ATPase [Neisseria zoodegmatis]|uniref:ATPase n=1 Tax=Neisseria zoodegmatis TaxID=326523 RepID=A0AB38DRI9_9NEIS|nr:AAA family ATPase [Neisseria zoodegmatis]OSI11472.1 ATPase [Neisseria zoodegmatis]SNU79978.1 ATPase associated with various cellular activities [Neisseria zoodegmatis]